MHYFRDPKFRRNAVYVAAAAFFSLTLAGCDSDARLDPNHAHEHSGDGGLEGVAGRLALVEHGGDRLHVMNVAERDEDHEHDHDDEHGHDDDHEHDHDDEHGHDDDHGHGNGHETLLSAADTLFLDRPGMRLHASASGRYVVATSRDHDLVQFVDSGLSADSGDDDDHDGGHDHDHGDEHDHDGDHDHDDEHSHASTLKQDHDHDHDGHDDDHDHGQASAGAPQVLSLRLHDSRPTHFQNFGDQSALFFDGNTGVASASVAVFDDAGIESNNMDFIPRTHAQHGAAQVVGNVAFVTRQEDVDSFLPERIDRLERLGGQFRHIQTYDVQCPGLHGSASNGGYTAFGCQDGLVLIDRQANGFPASKMANPEGFTGGTRIGTLAGHADVTQMVGIAAGRPYLIDPAHGEIRALVGWPGDHGLAAHAFDGHGDRFVALDDAGVLHIFDTEQGWDLAHSRALLGAQNDEDLPAPSLAVSGNDGLAFVTDPINRLVIVVDLESGDVVESVEVDYVPSGLVWLGRSE